MKVTRLGWISLLAAALIGTAAAQAPEESVPPPSPQIPEPQPSGPTKTPARTATPSPTTRSTTAMSTHDPEVLRDIESTMGFVPQWLRSVPPALLPGFWQGIKSLQLSNETKLDIKTKELIALAVAAQIPCEYCIMFHTQAARMNGATDQEIQEAVGMAAITREASTLLNGLMIDKTQFKKDLDRMSRGKAQARK